jgi:hypothetical protein
METLITPESLAWEILKRGEFDRQAISMAHDRAACAVRHPPASIGDYLYWLETEADTQETQAEAFPDEAPRRQTLAAALREIADRLRDLGFEPVNPTDLHEGPDVPATQTPVCSLEKNITLPD